MVTGVEYKILETSRLLKAARFNYGYFRVVLLKTWYSPGANVAL